MGKKRTFSPGSDEPQNCPRLKQTRLENFLLPSPHPSTAEAALVDIPPPPPYSQTTTPEPHVSPTSPSGPYQQQPSVSTSASYQPSDSDNLILQHSLLVSSTINLVFSYLEKVVSLLKGLLKGPRSALSQPYLKAVSHPQDPRNLPKPPLSAHANPPLSSGHLNKLASLVYDSNSIAITIPNWARNHRDWNRLALAKNHLASLLRIKPPYIDLIKTVRLTPLRSTKRFLLFFHSSQIPRMLLRRSTILSHDGIFIQRHFKNTLISSLFPPRTRTQKPREVAHTPASIPTSNLNSCPSLTPYPCPMENPTNSGGKTDTPILAGSPKITFENSNSSLPAVAPHTFSNSLTNLNTVLPDTSPPLASIFHDNNDHPTMTPAQVPSSVPSLYPICHIDKPSNTGSFLLVDATIPDSSSTNPKLTNPNSSPLFP